MGGRGSGAVARLRRLVRSHSPRTWAFWTLGAVALLLLPLGVTDPAILVFLLDPELLALLVASAAAYAATAAPWRAELQGARVRTMRTVAGAHLCVARVVG